MHIQFTFSYPIRLCYITFILHITQQNSLNEQQKKWETRPSILSAGITQLGIIYFRAQTTHFHCAICSLKSEQYENKNLSHTSEKKQCYIFFAIKYSRMF